MEASMQKLINLAKVLDILQQPEQTFSIRHSGWVIMKSRGGDGTSILNVIVKSASKHFFSKKLIYRHTSFLLATILHKPQRRANISLHHHPCLRRSLSRAFLLMEEVCTKVFCRHLHCRCSTLCLVAGKKREKFSSPSLPRICLCCYFPP